MQHLVTVVGGHPVQIVRCPVDNARTPNSQNHHDSSGNLNRHDVSFVFGGALFGCFGPGAQHDVWKSSVTDFVGMGYLYG